VALRTLRQLPKTVGQTPGGEPIYEVRSVQLLLDGTAGNFVRLAECSRCGKELAGAPVLTAADLDRPLRPMICSDCIRSAGVSTVWDSEGGEPPAERREPAALAANQPAPASAAAEAKPERLHVMEGHLRAVTDRVNELGRVARAHQADVKERAKQEEASAAALRGELAALRAATDESRAELQHLAGVPAELQRLAGAQAELTRRWEERPPGAETGAAFVQLRDEVAQLARLVEAQRGQVMGFVAAIGETQMATGELAAAEEALAERLAGFEPSKVEEMIAARLAEAEGRLAEELAQSPGEVDLSKVEELIATRVADAEGRLAQQTTRQRGDLEAAIEGAVTAHMAALVRANEKLASGQAVLEERIDVLADQVTVAYSRMELVLDRLAALEASAFQAPAPPAGEAPAGSFLESLDKQLEAAARRLAARSQAGAGRSEPEGRAPPNPSALSPSP
jgi:hypothetical protein